MTGRLLGSRTAGYIALGKSAPLNLRHPHALRQPISAYLALDVAEHCSFMARHSRKRWYTALFEPDYRADEMDMAVAKTTAGSVGHQDV